MSGSSWKSDEYAPIKLAVLCGFKTGEYHDLVLECQEYQFQAHKVIICNQSPWLAKAVKEKKKSTVIQLPEENAHIASAMLHYLYAATYTYPPTYHTLSTSLPPSMLFHLQLYTLADTLVIARLKALAQSSFQQAATKEWATPVFPETIKRVYEITNGEDQLRGIVVKIAAEHGKELMGKGGAFGVMMGEVAEFGRDVFQVMMGASSVVEMPAVVGEDKMVAYRCPVCPFEFYAKTIGRSEIACSGCGVVSKEGEWRGVKVEEIDENRDAEMKKLEDNAESKVNGGVMETEVAADMTEKKIEWNAMRVNGECVKDKEAVSKAPEAELPQVPFVWKREPKEKLSEKRYDGDGERQVEHVDRLGWNEEGEIVTTQVPILSTEGVILNEKEKNVSERADSANGDRDGDGDGGAGSAEVKECAEDTWETPAFPKKKKGKKGKKSPGAVNALPTSPRATESQIMGWT